MTLSKKVERDFSAATKKKGQPYFWQRHVAIVRAEDDLVKAKVNGSGGAKYEVDLSWKPPDLVVRCTCPYFEQYEACKHIWATILTVDDRKLLAKAANAPRVIIEEDIPDDDLDEDDEEDELEEFALTAPEFAAMRRAGSSSADSKFRAPEVPAWRRRSSRPGAKESAGRFAQFEMAGEEGNRLPG